MKCVTIGMESNTFNEGYSSIVLLYVLLLGLVIRFVCQRLFGSLGPQAIAPTTW